MTRAIRKYKTGRKYGRVYRFILSYAAIRGSFCVSELTPPLEPGLAAKHCKKLSNTGRLELVTKAEIGRNRQRARYRAVI